MRKSIAAAILLTLGGSALSASAQSLRGSDTLEGLTKALLADSACNPGNVLSYSGGGSGMGENAMRDGMQQIAPMSRALGVAANNVCTGTQIDGQGEGMVFALDGLLVLTGSAQSVNCGGGHAARAANTVPTPGFSDAVLDWKTTLRRLYGGNDGTGSAAQCNTAERQAIASNYRNLFQGGCTSTSCTTIKHAFRRSDLSGTTDVFKTLVGTLTNFCNGNDQQDRDPIRRPCTDEEQVCQADGTLGLLLPIRVPTTGTGATTTDDLNFYRAAGNPNAVNKCKAFASARVNEPFDDPGCCVRARAGDLGSACLAKASFALCYWPHTSNRAGQPLNQMCLNGFTEDCFDHNIPAPDAARNVRDSRVYNLTVRLQPGAHDIALDTTGRELSNSYFRIYTTKAGANHSGINGNGLCPPSIDSSGQCQQIDETRQIGCLTKAVECNVGYAGREAQDETFAEPLALSPNGTLAPIDPTITTIQNLINTPAVTTDDYPMARKLYLNTIVGFGAVTGAQLSLASCFATPAKVNPQISTFGFIPLPGATSDPICEDACDATPNSCVGNAAPFN